MMSAILAQQKKHVGDFLKSYLLWKQITDDEARDEENYETSEHIQLSPVSPFHDRLKAGQIRLLSQTEKITYVVLLKRWERNSFVVMPFSHFDAPATEEELLTDYNGGLYQNVLQAWNVRTLTDRSLKKSWVVGTLPQNDLDDAWKLWEATLGGQPLEERILARTGVPIYRKNDPRLDYKQEELDNFVRLDDADMEFAECCPTLVFSFFSNSAMPEMTLAAGNAEENLWFTYTPEGLALECQLEVSRQDHKALLYVYDADGNESTALDGCQLLDNDTRLGTIQNGVLSADWDATPDSELRLVDAQGNELKGNFQEGING